MIAERVALSSLETFEVCHEDHGERLAVRIREQVRINKMQLGYVTSLARQSLVFSPLLFVTVTKNARRLSWKLLYIYNYIYISINVLVLAVNAMEN